VFQAVIASEAKQSIFCTTGQKAGLLRRFAPRNDGTRAVGHILMARGNAS
jgi:hypothetical protein